MFTILEIIVLIDWKIFKVVFFLEIKKIKVRFYLFQMLTRRKIKEPNLKI